MKVAIYSTKKYERVYLEKSNRGKHDLLFLEEALSPETAALAKDCSAISIFTNDDASGSTLQQLAQLNIKCIATRAAGYDNIDIHVAEELKLQVANVPEYSPYAIAEHTIAIKIRLKMFFITLIKTRCNLRANRLEQRKKNFVGECSDQQNAYFLLNRFSY